MTKIKIISNPYEKRIAYQSWDNNNNLWTDIAYGTHNNSTLLNRKLTTGFFPFKVKEIVDKILFEYRSGEEKVEIIFEGTEDEFNELQELCKEEPYSEAVELHKSAGYLENARDILPDINELFDEKLRPLIMQSVNDYEKVRKEIDKYADASNDIVPICVLGNYSTGKSTFINALIGSEILPSGAEPITAKIYKIKQSDYDDRAHIIFRYDEEPIKIKFDGNKFKFSAGTTENVLTQLLTSELSNLKNTGITVYVNKALEIINNFDSSIDAEKVSDLIEIEVPFVAGLWRESSRQFVIFDTPGSNSATNNKHLKVLKEAMAGFSNGLPIFISQFDALDSTDNEDLYREIESMKELDNRFTMIVVNKADAAELDKGGFTQAKEQRILGETVPRNLYSSGLFFVSSVMGLGSKSNGEFIDDHYAELFDEKKNKFEDSTSRFYKQLYIYNIMPEQLKKRMSESASRHSNLLFANSGLFSVEREIQTFAGKYSAYNKCQQAQLFLGKVIETTYDDIATAKAERERSRQNRDEHLKKDEKELLDRIENASEEAEAAFCAEYEALMDSLDDNATEVFSKEQLETQESEIEKTRQSDNSYGEKKSEVNSSFSKLLGGLKSNVKKVFTEHNLEAVKTVGRDLSSDISTVRKNIDVLNDTEKTVDKETAERLLTIVSEEFSRRFNEAKTMLDNSSKTYWSERSAQFKTQLIKIVTGAEVLDEDKRQELETIILTYGNIVFEHHADDIFLKENFKKGIKIGSWALYESDKLNIDKIVKRYNNEMTQKVIEICQTIQGSHTDSFEKWKENLVNTVSDKIVEYSPALHSQAQIIREETEKIRELEAKQKQLAFYTQTIRSMMEWKEA